MKTNPLRKLIATVLLIAAIPSANARAGALVISIGGSSLAAHMTEEIDDEGKLKEAALSTGSWSALALGIACLAFAVSTAAAMAPVALCMLSDNATPVTRLDDEFFAKNGYSDQERDGIRGEAARFTDALKTQQFVIENQENRVTLRSAIQAILPDVSEEYLAFVTQFYGVL